MSHVQITDAPPRVDYTVNSSPQSVFAIPFAFFEFTDIVCYVGGVAMALNADFSVSGSAVDGGYESGALTLTDAVSSTTVSILRETPIDRTEDFPYPSNTLNIEALNTSLDRITAWDQEITAQIGRTIGLAPDDPAVVDLTVPSVATRANGYLGFDGDGNATVLGPPAGTTAVSAAMAAVLTAATTWQGAKALGLRLPMAAVYPGNRLYVDYGAGNDNNPIPGLEAQPFKTMAAADAYLKGQLDTQGVSPTILLIGTAKHQVGAGFTVTYQLTGGTEFSIGGLVTTQNVAGVANNGSGACRVQLPTTAGIYTGQPMVLAGIVGATEANGRFVVTLIDGTHVDLQGSTYGSAYVSGGTATTGSVIEGDAGATVVTFRDGASTATINNAHITTADGTGTGINGSQFAVGDCIGLSFGPLSAILTFTEFSASNISGDLTLCGNFVYALDCGNANLEIGGLTIHIPNALTFTDFMICTGGGKITNGGGLSIDGAGASSCTGIPWLVDGPDSAILLAGVTLPGNAPGVRSRGGACDAAPSSNLDAHLLTPVTDATGDGTTVTLKLDTVDLDESHAYLSALGYTTSSGVFKFPPTLENYRIAGSIALANLGSAHTELLVQLVTGSGSAFTLIHENPYTKSVSGAAVFNFPFKLESAEASDTFHITVMVQTAGGGGGKTVTLDGNADKRHRLMLEVIDL